MFTNNSCKCCHNWIDFKMMKQNMNIRGRKKYIGKKQRAYKVSDLFPNNLHKNDLNNSSFSITIAQLDPRMLVN